MGNTIALATARCSMAELTALYTAAQNAVRVFIGARNEPRVGSAGGAVADGIIRTLDDLADCLTSEARARVPGCAREAEQRTALLICLAADEQDLEAAAQAINEFAVFSGRAGCSVDENRDPEHGCALAAL